MDTDKKTIIVLSDDLDKAAFSFILANGAAALGNDVMMFFTFWGVNILRKPTKQTGSHRTLATRFATRGPGHLRLSKWHFGGFGPAMFRKRMQVANVASVQDMIATAREQGVRFVACGLCLDLLGLSKDDLIDDVEIAGVATYFEAADEANVNLLI